MESKDTVSSCSDKDKKDLQHLRERKNVMKESCHKNIREIESYVKKLKPRKTSDASSDSTKQLGKCSGLGEITNVEGVQISKDVLEDDNVVAGASHDKDNITEVQSSNNKVFENVFARDHDKKT
ncbi:hypothetical protein Tco_1224257 [Tanacetum coccineum]